MKYLIAVFGVIAVVCGICFCRQKPAVENDFVRIHVTANSTSASDENIKYLVKDAVVEFLIPYLADAQNKQEAQKIIEENLPQIENVVCQTLKNQNVFYGCRVSIESENMPTRAYGDLVLEEGVYDCLKIDLGQAKGDNWWCVVFPAVCFVSSKNPQNYEYISKIWDIINKEKR